MTKEIHFNHYNYEVFLKTVLEDVNARNISNNQHQHVLVSKHVRAIRELHDLINGL